MSVTLNSHLVSSRGTIVPDTNTPPPAAPELGLQLAAAQATIVGAPAVPQSLDVQTNQLLAIVLQQMQALQGTVGTLQVELTKARQEAAEARQAAANAVRPDPAPTVRRQTMIPFNDKENYTITKATSVLLRMASDAGLHLTLDWQGRFCHVTVEGENMAAQRFMGDAMGLPPRIW